MQIKLFLLLTLLGFCSARPHHYNGEAAAQFSQQSTAAASAPVQQTSQISSAIVDSTPVQQQTASAPNANVQAVAIAQEESAPAPTNEAFPIKSAPVKAQAPEPAAAHVSGLKTVSTGAKSSIKSPAKAASEIAAAPSTNSLTYSGELPAASENLVHTEVVHHEKPIEKIAIVASEQVPADQPIIAAAPIVQPEVSVVHKEIPVVHKEIPVEFKETVVIASKEAPAVPVVDTVIPQTYHADIKPIEIQPFVASEAKIVEPVVPVVPVVVHAAPVVPVEKVVEAVVETKPVVAEPVFETVVDFKAPTIPAVAPIRIPEELAAAVAPVFNSAKPIEEAVAFAAPVVEPIKETFVTETKVPITVQDAPVVFASPVVSAVASPVVPAVVSPVVPVVASPVVPVVASPVVPAAPVVPVAVETVAAPVVSVEKVFEQVKPVAAAPVIASVN